MTSPGSTDPLPALPLGAGSIISESFSIFFRHITAVVLIGILPILFGQLVPALLFGLGAGMGQLEQEAFSAGFVVTSALAAILQMLGYAVTAALLVQLAYDAKLKRRVRSAGYFRPALSAILPVIVLSFGATLILIGVVLLFSLIAAAVPFLVIVTLPVQVVFSLWIIALFSVTVPAVVIERAGLRGLARSAELTKGYRWPILGTLFLTALCAIALTIALAFLAALVGGLAVMAGPVIGTLIATFLIALVSTAGIGVLGIAVALTYARLREIKEGISVDQIAAVFD